MDNQVRYEVHKKKIESQTIFLGIYVRCFRQNNVKHFFLDGLKFLYVYI